MLFDDGRLLFFDARHIESMEDSRLVLNPPLKRGPCLLIEKDWELGGVRPASIVKWDGLYRMYGKAALKGEGQRYTLVFYTSRDGIAWDRPDLGVVDFNGSKRNSLVDIGDQDPHEVCVFVDPAGPDEHRFKCVAHNPNKDGLYLLTSPDGLVFRRWKTPLLEFTVDNHMSAFYDPRVGKYRIYLRGWDKSRPCDPVKGSRMVSLAETDDVLRPLPFDPDAPDPWPVPDRFFRPEYSGPKMRAVNRELPIVMRCDGDDPPEMGIYQAAAVQYLPEAYVAFPSVYYKYPWPPEGFINDGVLDLQFASSRDGVAWRRDFRGSYVRLDLPDGPATKQMHMLLGIVPGGHRLMQYCVGARRTHGQGRVPEKPKPVPEVRPGDPVFLRLEQRMDGFVSLDSDYAGGMVVTRPFVLDADRLTVNIDTSAGGVAHAALLGANGEPVPGYGLDESDRIQGNDTRYPLGWRKQPDLRPLRGRKLRLQLRSRSARLFAVYPAEKEQHP